MFLKRWLAPTVLVLLPLLTGTVIYWFSDRNFLFLNWFSVFCSDIQCREARVSLAPAMLVDYVPDGCWAFALASFLALLWLNPQSRISRVVLLGALAGMSYEVGQGLGFFPGTVSFIDLVVGMLAGIAGAMLGWKWKGFSEMKS